MNNPTGQATRKVHGWHPTVAFANGGRLVGVLVFPTMEQAKFEAWQMIECMEQYPAAFEKHIPQANQLIDLSEV